MRKKQPTLADVMKKLEALEAEVRALRAQPHICYHYTYPQWNYPYYPYYPWGTYVYPNGTGITIGSTGANVNGGTWTGTSTGNATFTTGYLTTT